jgi:L-iditol 2-dehydrogenase
MKAAYIKVPFKVLLREVPVPEIGANEVLVRVAACGVCGSDLHLGRDLAKEDWLPIGHEFCGLVEKVGAAVTRWQPGDPVIDENHTSLATSAAAKNGELANCTDLYITMNDSCMAEFVRTHELALHRNPGLSPGEGALAEPLTVALDLIESGGMPLGGDVAVFGGGTIGLMAARLARLRGARKVVLSQPSHSKARVELARELGVDRVVHPDREDAVQAFRAECPSGYDRVFVTAPVRTIPEAIPISRFGAIICFNGVDNANPLISFDANEFHYKRLQLRGIHSLPNLRFPMAIDLLARKAIDGRRFISHTFPLEEAQEAVSTAAFDKERALKVMVLIGGVKPPVARV